MAANRIMRGGAMRRARLRLVPAVLAAAALAALAAGCGGKEDHGPTTAVPDREGDAAILNRILARQEAAVEAYGHALPWLTPPLRRFARAFQAQEEEHVDATIKALRGIGAPADPEMEEIVAGRLRSGEDALGFLYELEAATIRAEHSAIGALSAPGARMLLAATMADQAQHLVWLRRALGAKPLATFPEAFESGSLAAP